MVKLLKSILKIKFPEIWKNDTDSLYNLCKTLENYFWKVFLSWLKIEEQNMISKTKVINEHLWYIPKVTVENKLICFNSFANTGFIFVGDFLYIDGTIISFELRCFFP